MLPGIMTLGTEVEAMTTHTAVAGGVIAAGLVIETIAWRLSVRDSSQEKPTMAAELTISLLPDHLNNPVDQLTIHAALTISLLPEENRR
jgi:hypothetical protein